MAAFTVVRNSEALDSEVDPVRFGAQNVDSESEVTTMSTEDTINFTIPQKEVGLAQAQVYLWIQSSIKTIKIEGKIK